MNPHQLLVRYPGEALPWLRRQLRLNRRAFAAWLGVSPADVARWERRDSIIPRGYSLRLVPLLERYLVTPEGQAFAQSLGRGEASEEEGDAG